MTKFPSRRVLLATGLTALTFAAVAVAYFSTTGSGGGSGSVTATTSDMPLSGSASWSKLGTSQTITISASNSSESAQHIDTVSVTAVTEAAGCPDGSFDAGAVTVTDHEVAPGETEPVATVSVQFVNLANAAQNGCIGSDKVAFTYAAN